MKFLLILMILANAKLSTTMSKSKENLLQETFHEICNAKICRKCAKFILSYYTIPSEVLKTCQTLWLEPRCCFNRLHISLWQHSKIKFYEPHNDCLVLFYGTSGFQLLIGVWALAANSFAATQFIHPPKFESFAATF